MSGYLPYAQGTATGHEHRQADAMGAQRGCFAVSYCLRFDGSFAPNQDFIDIPFDSRQDALMILFQPLR
jgi:hypothetical protein